ncbi:transmembrane protein 61-like [Latimeria chalumnae]|uniref:transmembrane protein 61-like n=1 Tax=Latimeria chalumnae TaxID=7897 RepID=UPI00313B0218
MTSSFRYGVTITGTILLVAGTLCFAWWSDGELMTTGDSEATTQGELQIVPASSSSNSLLRSVSFFCCGIGGILLLFGLLWSVKVNATAVSRTYQYQCHTDFQHRNMESREKLTHSNHEDNGVPSYEEALNYRPVPGVVFTHAPLQSFKEQDHPPSYQTLIDNRLKPMKHTRSLSDSALLKKEPSSPMLKEVVVPGVQVSEIYSTPPPSYDNISLQIV